MNNKLEDSTDTIEQTNFNMQSHKLTSQIESVARNPADLNLPHKRRQ